MSLARKEHILQELHLRKNLREAREAELHKIEYEEMLKTREREARLQRELVEEKRKWEMHDQTQHANRIISGLASSFQQQEQQLLFLVYQLSTMCADDKDQFVLRYTRWSDEHAADGHWSGLWPSNCGAANKSTHPTVPRCDVCRFIWPHHYNPHCQKPS